jgi:hypothetical protein
MPYFISIEPTLSAFIGMPSSNDETNSCPDGSYILNYKFYREKSVIDQLLAVVVVFKLELV